MKLGGMNTLCDFLSEHPGKEGEELSQNVVVHI